MSDKGNKLEDLFKDSFQDFEAEVNPSVWKNVQTGIKGAGLAILIKTAIKKMGSNAVVAVISSVATVLSTVAVLNWSGAKSEKTAEPAEPNVKVENPAPAKVEEIRDFLSDNPGTAAEKKTETPLASDEKLPTIGKNKQELESVINSLSGQNIATIAASNVGGAVPLIVSLSNEGHGKINNWDYGDGVKESNKANPIHVYETPGIYTVTLTSTSADGKTAVDKIKVEVTGNSSLPVTSDEWSITPNGDSITDVFAIKGANLKEMRMVIFDSKKNIVKSIHLQLTEVAKASGGKQASGLEGQWDGKDAKGRPVREGTYYYILNAVGLDGKKYDRKGKINLTR